MLINLRNALMAGKRLPYDAEVEYLAATGTQWINSGVDAWGDIEFEVLVDFSDYYPTSSSSYGICGAYVGTGGKQIYAAANNYSNKRYVGGRDGFSFPSFGVDTFHGRVDLIRVLKTGAYINDAVWRAGTTSNVNENGYTFMIFSVAGYSGYNLVGAIRSCKIWKSGVLVRDFIPVRKGTVGYLYDRVTGKLFGNAGTGDFVLGPDKN